MAQQYMLEFDKYDVIKIAGGSIIGLSLFYLGKIINSYSFFKSRGIPTPNYKFISGNLDEIYKTTYADALREWSKKYGKTYGIYEGHLPILVTSDLEIIQDVFINRFSDFSGRKALAFVYDNNKQGLFQSSRNRWKRFRSIINPTFSPAKMKQLIPFLKLCSSRFLAILDKNLGQEINLEEYFNNLAMDVVWNCAYGIDIDCQNKPGNPYLKRIKNVFNDDFNRSTIVLSLIHFYELKPFILGLMNAISFVLGLISSNLTSPVYWVQNNVKSILVKRQTEKINRKDYVQILLDAVSDNVDKNNDQKSFSSSIEKKIDFDELINNLGMFLFAGMDTVSTTLTNCLYVLMQHPEEMTKLQEEIDSDFDMNLEKDDEVYENVKKLEYLDMFIKEVSRMYPVASSVVSRKCTNHTTIKGIDIPEETIIAADVMTLHYNAEHWGEIDPNIFHPLRFSPEYKRNKAAFMPFGYGPMSCVGKNFAILEIKLVLIKLLKNFNVHSSNKNENVIFVEASNIRKPKGGLKCVFTKRNKL